MKSAIERQAERDKAARMRLAAEDHARELAAYIAPDDNPDVTRRERDKERNNPSRMPCCGAPKDGSDPSNKYSRRHRRGTDMREPTEPCVAARECNNRSYNPDGELKALKMKERGPDRMPCCGAPKAGDEVTDKFYQRHRSGSYGLKAGSPCVPAAKCRTLYNRLTDVRRRV